MGYYCDYSGVLDFEDQESLQDFAAEAKMYFNNMEIAGLEIYLYEKTKQVAMSLWEKAARLGAYGNIERKGENFGDYEILKIKPSEVISQHMPDWDIRSATNLVFDSIKELIAHSEENAERIRAKLRRSLEQVLCVYYRRSHNSP